MQKKIGNYTILKQIGTGGFGEVYLARQEVINRDVAMKVILPTHANQPEFIQRFQQEAEIIAKLENPHIVPLYDYWRDPDGAYLVMRYIRGGNLADSITTKGAFDIERAAKLLEQVAEALYIAHRNKVIHQDIKPANILLDDDGNAYLTDFGIARDFEGNVNLAEDDSKTMHGSPKYISPEHLRRKEITYRSDIYSLGLLMYEVLTGVPPYEGTQLIELLQHHVRTPLPTLQEKAPQLPPELNQPIMQATLKDPLSRYDSVIKFSDDFRKVVNQIQNPQALAGIPPASHFLDVEDTGRFDLFKPYKGLQAFQESDVNEFYGRSALIKALTKRMVEKGEYSRFLAVIGSSGSGKSSVIRAGLIPALRKGEIVGFPQYITTMTPTANPMRSLEGAILKVAKIFPPELMNTLQKEDYDLNSILELALPKDGELLLFIDQFEEVFTLVPSEEQRRSFLNMLHRALTAEKSKIRLIVAMRADFLDRPLMYGGWGDMVRERSEIVPPLKPAELREAIEKPAKSAKLLLEDGLADLIIEEMSQQAGALPLLQYTLSQLYEKREGLTLTVKVFRDMKGISGALAQRAEEIYKDLTDVQKNVAKIVFPRLIRFGAQSRTRQRIFLSEVYSLDGANPAIREMINSFGENRLLTFDYDAITRFPTLEVAHEALINSWTTLKNWLDENEGALRLQERLASDAKQWHEQKQDESFLAAGTRLAQYTDIESHPIIALTKREGEFLNASMKAEELRRLKERRRQQLVMGLAVAMGVLAVVSGILAYMAYNAANEAVLARDAETIARQAADENALIARQRELAASSLVNTENRPATALLLSLESLAISDNYEGRNALLMAMSANTNWRIAAYYNGHNDFIRDVAISDDASQLVTASRDGSIIVWDANNREAIAHLNAHTVPVNAVDIRGGTIASADNSGNIFIWENGSVAHELSMGANQIGTLAFSPDGRLLAAANAVGQVNVWSTEDYSLLLDFAAHETNFIYSLVFAPDGNSFATGGADNRIKLWNLEGELEGEFVGHSGAVTSLAFSPDGLYLGSGSVDMFVRVWNVADRTQLWGTQTHQSRITSLNFTDNGAFLISGDMDALVVIWNVATGRRANFFFNLSRSEVSSLVTVGNRVFVAGDNNALIEYYIDYVPRLGENIASLTGVNLMAVAAGQDEIAYAGTGDFSIHRGDETLAFHTGDVTGLAFSGDRLISVSVDRNAVLWGASPTANLREDALFSVAVHGDTVALGLNRGTVELWSIAGNEWEYIASLSGHTNRASELAFSPDGTRLVSGSRDNSLIIWDVETQSQLFALESADSVEALAWSPDGTIIASGSRDFSIQLWNAQTGEAIGTPLVWHDNFVLGLAFSPDGKILASVSGDRSVLLWSIPEARLLGAGLYGHTDWVNALAFTPDGSQLYTVGQDGQVFAWEMSLDSWKAAACEIVNRGLTESEEREYFNESFVPQRVCEE